LLTSKGIKAVLIDTATNLLSQLGIGTRVPYTVKGGTVRRMTGWHPRMITWPAETFFSHFRIEITQGYDFYKYNPAEIQSENVEELFNDLKLKDADLEAYIESITKANEEVEEIGEVCFSSGFFKLIGLKSSP
jgi:hypothetical protein